MTERAAIDIALAAFRELCEAGVGVSDVHVHALIDADIDLGGVTLAELIGARVDLSGLTLPELIGARVDLSGLTLPELIEARVDLDDSYAVDLERAGVDLSGLHVPDIHRRVYDAVGEDGEHLNMGRWHSPCGTEHCRAGWAVTLAGEAGSELEAATDTALAAEWIYRISDPDMDRLPSRDYHPLWHADNTDALDDIRRRADA